MAIPWTDIGNAAVGAVAVAAPITGAAWAAFQKLNGYLKERAEEERKDREEARKDRADARDERDAFLKFAREEASQRRDLAAERRDAYERHVAAIGQALKADRDPARVELLSAMLRKAQDEWVDHLRRTARFLDEGDPSLLDDPIYSRNLWDQLRRDAPRATEVGAPLAGERVTDLTDLLSRVDRAVEVETSKEDILAQANALRGVSKFEEAVGRYREVLAQDAENFDARFGLAYSLVELKRYDDGFQEYSRALELRPENAATLYNRGYVLDDLGHHEEALRDYNRSLELWPDDPATLNNRGIALRNLGRHEEALRDYNRSLELRPDDPDTLGNRALAHEALGRHDDALLDYDGALAVQPDHANNLANRGAFLMTLGRHEEALRDLDKSLELRPGHEWTLARRAEAMKALSSPLGAPAAKPRRPRRRAAS